MGHTNSTANLSLPQFISTDKPTWLGDVNGAFSAIDTYAGTNDAAVAAAVSDASSAITQAAAAVNTANTANTTAGNASTAANNAIGVANTANAIAGTVDAKVGLLADLNTTDRTSIVNAINEVNGHITGVTVVASGTANTSYASQLAELYTAFGTLNADQQKKTALVDGNLFIHISDLRGRYSSCEASSDYKIRTFMLDAAKFYQMTSGTITDVSSNNNANSMQLILLG